MAQLVKDPPAMQETWIRSLGWEDPPGEGKCYPFQYSSLENSVDCIVHGVTKSQIQLSDFHFQALISEKETSHVGNSMQHALMSCFGTSSRILQDEL